jgi:hypothetical protein
MFDGSKYPFVGKDAAHVKKINNTVKEPAKIKATIDAYFACREEWYVQDRHSLGMLICKLVKFVPVASEPTTAAGGQFRKTFDELEIERANADAEAALGGKP